MIRYRPYLVTIGGLTKLRNVFKEYVVALVCPPASQAEYRKMLAPFSFGRWEHVGDDKQAIDIIRKLKPDLVVASRSMPVYSGAQLLGMMRKEIGLEGTPFVMIGMKEDLKAGGLAEQISKNENAILIGLPQAPDELAQTLVGFLDQFIDPQMENSYGLIEDADRLLRTGDRTLARVRYQEALSLYDRHPEAWLKLANIQASLGEVDDAESSYVKSLEMDQYRIDTYLALANFYEARQEYQQGIGILQAALGVAVVTKQSKEIKAQIIMLIGRLDLGLKRMPEAETSFNRAIETNPENAQLRAEIGDAYATHGHYAQAEAHYQAALTLDPNLAHVFNRLGIAYRRQGKFQKAIEFYQNARIHHPEDENLLFNMARAYFDAGQVAQAEGLLQEALTLAPAFKAAMTLLNKIQSQKQVIELDV